MKQVVFADALIRSAAKTGFHGMLNCELTKLMHLVYVDKSDPPKPKIREVALATYMMTRPIPTQHYPRTSSK
jgi:hypothetical protein